MDKKNNKTWVIKLKETERRLLAIQASRGLVGEEIELLEEIQMKIRDLEEEQKED
jgi:hypothetical protein